MANFSFTFFSNYIICISKIFLYYFVSIYIYIFSSQPVAPTAANAKKSQLFLIGPYLLENAEFTYIIMECFPVKST